MQLHDLVTRISDMSDEELKEHIRKIRHGREVVRTAKVKHEEREEGKEERKKTGTAKRRVSKALETMSKEDKLKLLAALQNMEGNDE